MKDLTLSQIFEEAFDRARDLDAPLGARLESIAESVRMANPAFAEAQDRLFMRLHLNGSGATAPAVGDPMPPFMLPDDQGHLVTLEELLAKGPVALSFQPGHWCPYCRINTNALAQAQCEVEPIGGQIVAITPDLQHFATALKSEAAAKPFPILTDVDNGYALSLNLAIFFGLEMQKFIKERRFGYCSLSRQRRMDIANSRDICRRPRFHHQGPICRARRQEAHGDRRHRRCSQSLLGTGLVPALMGSAKLINALKRPA